MSLKISRADLSDALFGAETSERVRAKDIFWFLCFCVVLGALLVMRRPDAIFAAQFWAEDGNIIFFQQFYRQGSLFTPIEGYFLLLPRLVGMIADFFPVLWAPLIYNLFGVAIAAVCCAWFSLPGFKHIISDLRLRAFACVMFAAMPSAGTVLLNLTNTQWYVLLWCALFSIQSLVTRKGKIMGAIVYLLFVFSTALSVVIAPVWILRAILRKKDRALGIALASLQIIYAGAINLLFKPEEIYPNPRGIPFVVLTTLKLAVSRVWMMAFIGPKFLAYNVPQTAISLAIAGLFFAVIAVLLLVRGKTKIKFLIQSALFAYLIFSPIFIAVLFRMHEPPETLFFSVAGSRYFFLSSALFYIWLLEIPDRFKSDRLLKYPAFGLLPLFVFLAWQNIFLIRPFENTDWPRWALGLEQVRGTGSKFPADIPLNPRPWVIPGGKGLPKETLKIALEIRPQKENQVQRTDKGWQSIGKNSYMTFSLPEPKYVYAVAFKYSMKAADPESPGALVSWDENEKNLSKQQALPATNGAEITKVIWILDRIQFIRINLPEDGELNLSEIDLLASPKTIP